MERMLERVISQAKERHQFGNKIAHHQSVSNRIVDMKMRLDASRILLYRSGMVIRSRGEIVN